MRTFIALELPKDCLEEIVRIQDLLRKQVIFTGKFTEVQNLHLTLKFLGDIKEEKISEVKKRLSLIKLGQFNVEIGEVGVFSRNHIKIIWIKLNGKGVFDLQKEIDKSLKDLFLPEERFMGHITIARVKHVSSKDELLDYLKSLKPKKIRFIAKNFFLKKSELFPEGPIYNNIEEFRLVS